MAMTHTIAQPDWTKQTRFQHMNNQMPWQLDAGVSFFPLSDEQQVNHAQFRQLQGDWLASAQPNLKRPSTDSSNSDPSKQSASDALTLKEKNRRAQRKFREKMRVSALAVKDALDP